MDALGPFEPQPVLAVAVSGGADSMALALLADRWARARGGCILALTVDHGLRAGSRAEAREAGSRLAAHGIAHAVLVWRGQKPASGVQAAARAARYRLLEDRCRKEGILHLLVAHHRNDQAETVAMRAARDSGPDGLAGMPTIAERRQVRVLRPLLHMPPARLRATLATAGTAWAEDPSNRDETFERVRVRRALNGAESERLAVAAGRAAAKRAARERSCARLLARHAWVHPEGYGWFHGAIVEDAPAEIARLAVARMIACVGGADYLPRRERLERLFEALAAGGTKGSTLGGCRLLPAGDGVLVVRETRGLAPPVPLRPGREAVWDRRFTVTIGRGRRADTTLHAGACGAGAGGGSRSHATLPAAAAALPVLCDSSDLSVPRHKDYGRSVDEAASLPVLRFRFTPAQPLCGAPFPVV